MPEPIVSLNEESLKSDLRELVRRTVEDTLNSLLEEEADDLVGAERYERTAEREAYRAGHYDGSLATSSGEVTIHQRCTVHFYRNVLARVPKSKRPRVAAMPRAIHAMESREAAEAKALEVASELEATRLREAAKVVREGFAETLPTRASPASTGGAYAPTTPSSASTGRSDAGRGWWGRSPTGTPPSCS